MHYRCTHSITHTNLVVGLNVSHQDVPVVNPILDLLNSVDDTVYDTSVVSARKEIM